MLQSLLQIPDFQALDLDHTLAHLQQQPVITAVSQSIKPSINQSIKTLK